MMRLEIDFEILLKIKEETYCDCQSVNTLLYVKKVEMTNEGINVFLILFQQSSHRKLDSPVRRLIRQCW